MRRTTPWALAGALCAAAVLSGSAGAAQPGDLDPTFGTNGSTSIGVAQRVRSGGVARQSDGRIVVVGGAWSSPSGDIALVRFTGDGTLDATFGTGGVVMTDLGGSEAASAVVALPDDRLVVASRSVRDGSDRLYLVRYLSNGALDVAFGNGGVVATPVDGLSGLPNGMAVQADGKIVAAGPAGPSGVDLVRYTSDGTLDSSFAGDGTITTPMGVPGRHASWHGVAVQPDGKIVVKANTAIGVELARYHADGTPDSEYGTDGHVGLALAFSATALVVQPDGKLVLGGLWSCGSACDFALARLTAQGGLDPTFGSSGVATMDLGGQDTLYALALQPDGGLLAAGGTRAGFPGNADSVVLRYSDAGVLDPAFGTGGVAMNDLGGDDLLNGLALEPDGDLVAAGEGFADSPAPPTRFVVARYLAATGETRTEAAVAARVVVASDAARVGDLVLLGASFELGAGSDGVDPGAEPVGVRIGALSLEAAAGSCAKETLGWLCRARVGEEVWRVLVRRLSARRYGVEAAIARAAWPPTSGPVEVALAIGNDAGTTTVQPLMVSTR
jgi:uncharacterized delta-60 repeat protein